MSAIQQMLLASAPGDPVGQQQYTSNGTFTWTAPAGVTSVCAVCIGAGGEASNEAMGGGGGGLGWKNNIPVIPGQSYTVVVSATADTYFISATTVKGGAANGGTGGTFVGDGGGNGGSGGSTAASAYVPYYSYIILPGGGGGAGGYTGNGGNGATATYDTYGNRPGSIGAGGTKGGNSGYTTTDATTMRGAQAGGAASLLGTVTQEGSWTGSASGGNGVSCGAGGGGGVPQGDGVSGASGLGAVRIIWGPNRAFPNTNTGNM